MNIIIAGCGRVGYALARQLNDEGHDITIIEKDAELLTPALSNLDVQGIVGNASSYLTQHEAGIEKADLMIAVTDQDEVNLIACLLAQKASKCRTIARVRNPQYFRETGYLKECMDISLILNPEYEAACEIAKLIQIPDAMEVDSFANDKVDLLRVAISENSPLHNMKVIDFSKEFNHEVLICILVHNREVIIPDGNTVLTAGDTISVILPSRKIRSFYRASKLSAIKDVRDVMIAGGGNISYYLAEKLIKQGIPVKIIEQNRERCSFLSDAFPKAAIIHSDAKDHDLLLEEGLARTDAFVSLTSVDEENVFLSLFAAKMAPHSKRIVKINRLEPDETITNLPIGSMISPKDITTETILQYVRSQNNSLGSNVEALYRLMDNRVEALEFKVHQDSNVTNTPLFSLKLKNNLLVCCIIRKNQIITPSGRDMIMKGDTVIIVTTEKGLQDISDILSE